MGLDLRPLVEASSINITELSEKVIAIDAYNSIYQFLATIRGPTGELLTNSKGCVTSHLSGLFYRNVSLLAENIKLIYVFDGEPNDLKSKEIEHRRHLKQIAIEKYEAALTSGKYDEARKYSQATSVLTHEMIEESKKVLALLGIPIVQAKSEGEASAAYLTKCGIAFGCASQDYDSLLFGAEKLIRNVTISGKRKIPNRNSYIDIEPEIIDHKYFLSRLSLTREQLVDVGILIGTDFNPEGFPGIGPKTALKLIKEYNKLENIEKIRDRLPDIPYQEIRDIFLRPEIPDVDNISFNEIKYDQIINFLCTEKNFSVDRVTGSLDRLKKSITNRNQSLERWFK
jgi:flap endonuclease-1